MSQLGQIPDELRAIQDNDNKTTNHSSQQTYYPSCFGESALLEHKMSVPSAVYMTFSGLLQSFLQYTLCHLLASLRPEILELLSHTSMVSGLHFLAHLELAIQPR